MNIIKELNLTQLQAYATENFVPVVKPDVATVLYDTIAKNKPKKVLEIGTAIGFSSVIILQANKNCTLTTIELSEERVQKAKETFAEFSVNDRVNLMHGDAGVIINNLKQNNEQFDFIFLDGPKGQYVHYFETLKQLLADGGIIFCDNLNFNNFVFGEGVAPKKFRTIAVNLKKFYNVITTDNQVKVELVHAGDTAAIITKLKLKNTNEVM